MLNSISLHLKRFNKFKAFTVALAATMALVATPTTVKAEGYWTDGYWDGTNNVWVDGYWTETGSSYNQATEWQPETYADGTIKVGNYSANLVYSFAQDVVDLPNTAGVYNYNGRDFIADHAYQGFSAIKWNNTAVVNGQTYHLVSRYNGYWGTAIQGRTIYLSTGEEMWYCWDGPFVMYTCSGDGLVVTYWN